MTEETESLILEHLRHIRGAVDRLSERVGELTHRVGDLEAGQAQIQVTLARHSSQFDRMAEWLDRIERRVGLVES